MTSSWADHWPPFSWRTWGPRWARWARQPFFFVFHQYFRHFLSFGNLVAPHKAEGWEGRGENRGGHLGQDCTRNDHNGQEAKKEGHRFRSHPFYRPTSTECQYSEILRPYWRHKGSFVFVAGKSFCLKWEAIKIKQPSWAFSKNVKAKTKPSCFNQERVFYHKKVTVFISS